MPPKDVRVLIVEDDPFARDLMALLLTRDWRTRVVGETDDEQEIIALLSQPAFKVDVVVLDTEIPGDAEKPFHLAEQMCRVWSEPRILCTGTKADPQILRRLLAGPFKGYILKNEIRYALAWAVKEAARGKWVATKGVWQLALQQRYQLPSESILLDGTNQVVEFSHRQWEIARLAILFNLSRRDVADELQVRPDWVSEVVSTTYDKLGLRDIVSGDVSVNRFIEDGLVRLRFEEVLSRLPSSVGPRGRSRKTSDMSTLAFHLLTIPDEKEIDM